MFECLFFARIIIFVAIVVFRKIIEHLLTQFATLAALIILNVVCDTIIFIFSNLITSPRFPYSLRHLLDPLRFQLLYVLPASFEFGLHLNYFLFDFKEFGGIGIVNLHNFRKQLPVNHRNSLAPHTLAALNQGNLCRLVHFLFYFALDLRVQQGYRGAAGGRFEGVAVLKQTMIL